MGIGRFFATLVDEFPGIKLPAKGLESEYLLVDFNSLIHDSFAETTGLLYSVARSVVFGKLPNCSPAVWREISELPAGKVMRQPFRDWLVPENVARMQATAQKMIAARVVRRLGELLGVSNFKRVHLFADGVPHIAKMIEQRARRFFGALQDRGREQILAQVDDQGSEWLFERVIYLHLLPSRNMISPGTAFMEQLMDYLRSKGACGKLELHISDDLQPGEGEHKLMRFAQSLPENKGPTRIAVYSPDADMIVLLLNDRQGGRVYDLLRQEHGTDDLICVRIPLLKAFVLAVVEKEMKQIRYVHDEDRIVADICFLYNVFGNDFVPVLTGIRVDNDFVRVTGLYVHTVLARNRYLVDGPNIDWTAITGLIAAFASLFPQRGGGKFKGGGQRHHDWRGELRQWTQGEGMYRADSRAVVHNRAEYYKRYCEDERTAAIMDYLLALKCVNQLYNGSETRLVKYWFYPHHKSPLLDDISAFLTGHKNLNGGGKPSHTDIKILLIQHERRYFAKHAVRFGNVPPVFQHLYTAPTMDILRRTVNVPASMLKIRLVADNFAVNEDTISRLRWDPRTGRLNVKNILDCSDTYYLNKCLPLSPKADAVMSSHVHPIDLFNKLAAAKLPG